MKIRLIPALKDNYMYLLIDEKSKECAVVDPVEPEKIEAAVREEGVNLTTVLTTHHHWDHAGGNETLIKKLGSKQVVGGDERIGALTRKVSEGDTLNIGSLNVKCLFTPCHTSGHICYYVTNQHKDPAVFTGDTLFVGGCGRFFEGTPQQMHDALTKLGHLPPETRVYCGHEYTVANLKFASTVEPKNDALTQKLHSVEEQRRNNIATIPSTIRDEKMFNPFMRVEKESVQSYAGFTDPVKVMGKLREDKNNF